MSVIKSSRPNSFETAKNSLAQAISQLKQTPILIALGVFCHLARKLDGAFARDHALSSSILTIALGLTGNSLIPCAFGIVLFSALIGGTLKQSRGHWFSSWLLFLIPSVMANLLDYASTKLIFYFEDRGMEHGAVLGLVAIQQHATGLLFAAGLAFSALSLRYLLRGKGIAEAFRRGASTFYANLFFMVIVIALQIIIQSGLVFFSINGDWEALGANDHFFSALFLARGVLQSLAVMICFIAAPIIAQHSGHLKRRATSIPLCDKPFNR